MMELQNQIYLLTAVFGGVCALLLVFIVILAIYVINVKKSLIVKDAGYNERRYENYGFEHEIPVHNITEDLRSMKSAEVIRRQPPQQKSNLMKQRNDDAANHNNARRRDKPQPVSGGGVVGAGGKGARGDERKRQYSESGDTSGRDFDSAFDNEINNMFDIDDYDDDRDSVVSDRNSRYNNQQQNHRSNNSQQQQGPPPPPPSATGQANRNRNFGHGGHGAGGRYDNNRQQQQAVNNRPPRGGSGYPGSMYHHSGNQHEGKTYFNDRGISY